ncbi:MAG: NAD(P)/FAD-dependent oxidoreductase, partial [Cyanobacteria bacterium P01_A01_bin.37]
GRSTNPRAARVCGCRAGPPARSCRAAYALLHEHSPAPRAARNRFAEASHGVLGYDGLSTKEIAQIGREQLLEYPTAHFVEGKAIRAERQLDESFLVELESGVRYQSQRIILAIGVVDHLPGIPGLAERWGKTVNQCPYCHGYELAGGSWGVLYTGEASLHQAKLILDWSDNVVFFSNGSDQISADILIDLESHGITIEDTPVESLRQIIQDLEQESIQTE